MSLYKGKAIAGTARIGKGWRIVQERIVNHYSKTQTTATPEFVELVGLQVEPMGTGLRLPEISDTYCTQT